MNEHNPEEAYSLGLSSGEFGDDMSEYVHDCPECRAEYQRGFDEGLNKLLAHAQGVKE